MIGTELNYWYKAEELQRFIAESEEARKKRKRFCCKSLMGFLLNRLGKISKQATIRLLLLSTTTKL